jgi:hypothetical protein
MMSMASELVELLLSELTSIASEAVIPALFDVTDVTSSW